MENNINGANTPGLAAQILARYRQTAQKFGPFFGQQIFTIVAQTPDLKWKEDVATGKNTFRQEVKAYILKAIDVESVSLLEKDVDGRPKIILNEKKNDPSLVFELADPEFMNKIRDGRINEIDRCCGCNEGCLDGFANLDMPHITCLRNPAVGREAECIITPSDNPRTVLVAGGGMAGMMAARTLRKRGHRVILCEVSNRLGGQFILAGSTPHKLDMKKAALEMGEQIVNLGIDVRLNTPVTDELIRQLKPDAVFNCVGSSPIIPSIPGSSLPNVVESHDIIDGKVKVSGNVVIIGGGMVGLETADLLVESGLTPPTVLEMGSAVCVDMGSARKYCMMQTIEDSKIACVTDIKVTEISENMVIGEKNGEHLEFPCDYAVFAVGSHSRDSHELKEACSELGIDLITVGDAKEARRALEATREAFDAALAF